MKNVVLKLLSVGGLYSTIGVLCQVFLINFVIASDLEIQRIKSVKEVIMNVNFNETKLVDVFKEIESKTEFHFVFDKKDLFLRKTVNVNRNNISVENVLLEISKQTGLSFHQINQNISIEQKLGISEVKVTIQEITVTGKVTSSEDNEGLPGVNVILKGTRQGTVTDADGSYQLGVQGEESILVFSFVGYTTSETTVGSRTIVDMALSPDVTSLDEIVVVGYGTKSKTSVTGAVSQVKMENIETSAMTNFSTSLAGRVPGLVVVQNSGKPGGDNPSLSIRGQNTLNNNSVLVVIDGATDRNINDLDPAAIESVTVLKDASAAIYGARAANGVILITTKRGSEGKAKLDVNFNYGLVTPTVVPEVVNSATYAKMLNELANYNGKNPEYTDEEIQKFNDGSDPFNYPNVNAYDEVFENMTSQYKGDISISGGSDKTRYFVSTGFKNQQAIYKDSDAGFSQVNFRTNFDSKISDFIDVALDFAGRYQDYNDNRVNWSYMFNRHYPQKIMRWPTGEYASGFQEGNNPAGMASDASGYYNNKLYFVETHAQVKIHIPWVEGLSVSANGYYDKRFTFRKQWNKSFEWFGWDGSSFDQNGNPELTNAGLNGGAPNLSQKAEDQYGLTLNAMIDYSFDIADIHNISAVLGTERINSNQMWFEADRQQYLSTAIDQLFAGSEIGKNNNGSESLTARLNYFGRVNYDFKQKYLIEFLFRYDGSYIFPEEGRYGFFPGLSGGWRVSEESFWKDNISFITYFKLRASWGKTGNDRIDPYQYLSSFSYGSPYIMRDGEKQTVYESGIANPAVTWEVANQTNFGFDAQFMEGKLDLTVDYFYNFRNNILTKRNASIPNSAGLNLPDENIGEVSNRGFEFLVGYNNTIGKLDFRTSFNMGYSKNRIDFWDEAEGAYEWQKSTGKPIGSQLYWLAQGVYHNQEEIDASAHHPLAKPGDLIFEDVNADGIIDGSDRVRYDKTSYPNTTLGLSFDLKYGNWFADVFFQGAFGAVRSYNLEAGHQGAWTTYDADGRWTPDNENSNKPRAWDAGSYYWTADPNGGTWANNNTYFLRSNNYVRLKTMRIGYRLPKDICDKMGINLSGMSIYFSGQNLLTFTKFKVFDPETVGDTYPMNKVFNLGVSLNF